jgi:copper transport protein
MSAARRAVVALLVAFGALGALAANAAPTWAHAALVSSTPRSGGHVGDSPRQVVLQFSEPVQVLDRSDVSVVDHTGQKVDTGAPHTAPGDSRRLVVPLHTPLVPDSYTVRYRLVSADSHSVVAALVYATGGARLRPPVWDGAGGLSDTSAVAVAARALELVSLGLLLGLIGFRALVWVPAVEAADGLPEAERENALRGGRRLFWRAFWALTILAGGAEGTILAAKSAVVFHTGLAAAAVDTPAASHLIAASRFGDLLGWRYVALIALAGVAFAVWTLESADAPAAGRRGPLAVMGALCVAALTLLAAQGHASQAPLAPLQISADVAHLGGAAIWLGGLPCLAAVLIRAPRAMPEAGRTLASAVLRRFSRVALWSVAVIVLTGLARLVGELSSPVELWSTAYGRDLVLKTSLLLPILVLARGNRRLVARLAGGLTPTTARLRSVARSVHMELAIGAGIIVVAAILVAQVPGRT